MPTRPFALGVLVVTLGLVACDRPDPSVMGAWTAANPEDRWTLEMRDDSTYSMQAGTLAGEGSFTAIDEEGTVQLEATGRMAVVMPEGFQARVEDDTLRLCSAAGCSAMVRVQDR